MHTHDHTAKAVYDEPENEGSKLKKLSEEEKPEDLRRGFIVDLKICIVTAKDGGGVGKV